ncbi:LuxR C-terminal-related transcriptional regulator [Actinoplanes sp. Pm04-4]|uniref:LuxR C-terminal-related transcriptional regulator n=1 Tax=Paractinoplanes pyxinae TaxID=2997416 RepID=A0ABT4AQY5_9ACTN|nr:LuxR C-terminal-related transcriptional regulator [Actinoplanes pyxinae]MCY1136646.1 LuxR C-terminal-related transcriptional regulator [Actinoplanes pyxinae]
MSGAESYGSALATGTECEETALATPTLPGLEAEAGLLKDLIDGLEHRGFALLLHGEPGIGKSTLLEVAAAQAVRRRMPVLSAAGEAAEKDMPYAALHRLLRPLRSRAASGPAALQVLSEAAQAGPMLVVVDDGHLLDEASVDALAFVARQLKDPIGLLVAGRPGPAGSGRLERAGFRHRRVRALSEASLTATAHIAYRRGMLAAAVSGLEQAAELSDDPELKGRRLLDAAELAGQLGDPERVLRLAGAAAGCALRPVDRHRLRWVGLDHRRAPVPAGVAREAARWARRTLEQGEYLLGFHLLRQAAERGTWIEPAEDLRDLIRAAAEPLPDSERVAFEALADPVTGALAGLPPDRPDAESSGDRSAVLGAAAARAGQFAPAVPLLNEAAYLFRAQRRQGRLVAVLIEQAWAHIHLGQYTAADENAVEGVRLAGQTGQPLWAWAGQLVVAAVRGIRGETDAALAVAAEVELEASAHHVGRLLARVQAVRGLTLLAAGRHEPALDALLRLFDRHDTAYDALLGSWMVGDLAEAAIQLGRAAEAHSLLPVAADRAERTGSDRAGAAVRHARALLATDEDAEQHFQRALADDRSAEPFLRARLQLAYGERLRRRRRVAASRLPLNAALTGFEALRLPAWTERARREARVAGLRVGPPPAAAPVVLTPADLEIARLASRGLSNRQIGQKLYLSHRTVAAHLYRIFPKLGITSRAQLHAALADLDVAEAAAG